MLEVRPTVAVTQTVSVSSQGTVGAHEVKGRKLPSADETLPKRLDDTSKKDVVKEPNTAGERLEDTVSSMNKFVQSVQRNLQFSVDEDLDKVVIKVVDGGSGELIRQIPEEVFLELARKLNDDGDFNLVNAMG